jgi:hypothetical protein
MGSDNLPAQVSDQERMMKKPGQKRQHHGWREIRRDSRPWNSAGHLVSHRALHFLYRILPRDLSNIFSFTHFNIHNLQSHCEFTRLKKNTDTFFTIIKHYLVNNMGWDMFSILKTPNRRCWMDQSKIHPQWAHNETSLWTLT